MKEQIITILEDNNLLASDLEGVFSAMSTILQLAADQTEENEPHAWKSIEKYRDISNNLYDVDGFINSISY